MPGVWWNQDGIAGADVAGFAVDLHGPLPFEDEVEFFAELVVMSLGWLANGNGGFGEALVLHGRVGAVQDAADGAAILGGEGILLGKLVDGHGLPLSLNDEARSATQKCLPLSFRRSSSQRLLHPFQAFFALGSGVGLKKHGRRSTQIPRLKRLQRPVFRGMRVDGWVAAGYCLIYAQRISS
jgi:hypothetical protein